MATTVYLFPIRRAQRVKTDTPLPFYAPTTLRVEGKEYHFRRSDPIVGVYTDRFGSLVTMTLDETSTKEVHNRSVNTFKPRFGEATFNIYCHESARAYFSKDNTMAEHIGQFQLQESQLPGVQYQLSGLLRDMRARSTDIWSNAEHRLDKLAEMLRHDAASIGQVRYGAHAMRFTQHDTTRMSTPQNPCLVTSRIANQEAQKTIEGVVSNTTIQECKTVELDKNNDVPRSEEEITFVWNDFKDMSRGEKRVTLPHKNNTIYGRLPIVGVYTHPFDKDRLLIMRLSREKKEPISRDRLFFNEVGAEEKNVAQIYFRWLGKKILADGLYIGESFDGYIDPQQRHQYLGKGIGTCLVDKLEQLTLLMYGATEIEFETERCFLKEGVRENRYNFFQQLHYGISKVQQDGGDGTAVCNFSKGV